MTSSCTPFSRPWSEYAVFGVWFLPLMQRDLYRFFKGLLALTGYVELVFMLAYLVAIFLLWRCFVAWHLSSELNHMRRSMLNHSTCVTFKGRPYLMLPVEEKVLKRVAEENRTFREISRGEA